MLEEDKKQDQGKPAKRREFEFEEALPPIDVDIPMPNVKKPAELSDIPQEEATGEPGGSDDGGKCTD